MEDSYAYIHCSGIRHSWGVQCGTDFFPNKVHQNFQIKKEDNIFEWMCYKIFASIGTRDLIILWIILGANLFKFLCLSLNLYLLLLFICLSLHFSNSIKLPIQRIEDILGRDYNVSPFEFEYFLSEYHLVTGGVHQFSSRVMQISWWEELKELGLGPVGAT